MLNFNQFKLIRHYGENPGIMRIFSVVFTIAAVRRPLGKPAGRLLEPFCLVVVGTNLHPFRFVVILDGVKKLAWHKLYIRFQSRLNPMVWKKLVWHKLYIRFRSRLNPMVWLLRNAQIYYIHIWPLAESDGAPARNAKIHYIHLRFQSYPMEDLPRNAIIRYIHIWPLAESDGERVFRQ